MGKNEGKRKWERDYEKYSNSTELDDRIEYLTNLADGKVAMKEEYAELKKLTAIKENLPKVKHILELKRNLEEQGNAIKKEIERRQLLNKYEQAVEVIENEMKKLQEEKARLEEEIKQNPEKKAELQTKLAENDKKRQENNLKFVKCQEGIANENKNVEQSQFKDTSIEDLKNNATELKQKISMCNYACNRLMQGYSWQSVEVALDKFQGERLTAKGQEAIKIKQNREAAKGGVQEEVQQEESEPKQIQQEETKQEETGLSEVSRWQKAKLWLLGIGTKTVNGVKKFIKKFRKPEEVEEVEEVVEETKIQPQNQAAAWSNLYKTYENLQQVEQEETQTDWEKQCKEAVEKDEKTEKETNAFRQYLKEIAEKGMDGVEKENKEARRQAAIEKLKANRAGKDTGAIITNLDKQINEQDNDAR